MAKPPKQVPETGKRNSILYVVIDDALYIAAYDKDGNYDSISRADQAAPMPEEFAGQTHESEDDYGHVVNMTYNEEGKLVDYDFVASKPTAPPDAPSMNAPGAPPTRFEPGWDPNAPEPRYEFPEAPVRHTGEPVYQTGGDEEAAAAGVEPAGDGDVSAGNYANRTVVRSYGGRLYYVTLSPTGQEINRRLIPGTEAQPSSGGAYSPQQQATLTAQAVLGGNKTGIPAATTGTPNTPPSATTSGSNIEDVRAAGSGGSSVTNPPVPTGTGSAGARGAFSKSIIAQQLQNAWDNPQALLRAFANYQDWDEFGGKEASVQALAPSLGILWMIAQDQAGKGAANLAGGGNRDYVNFIEPFMASIMKGTGGSMLDNPSATLATLLRPKGETLQNYLGAPGGAGAAALTRTDQVDNMINAARYGLQGSVATPVLNALLNLMSVQGRDYAAQELTGDTTGSFGQLLDKFI